MRKINTAISRFCYNHPNFGIPNLMLYIVIGNVIVYIMDMMSHGTFSAVAAFIPYEIFHGQVWRLVSFIFVPEAGGSVLWFAIGLYVDYLIGTQLERQWGTARFNVFYFSGVVLTALTGLLLGAVSGGRMVTASMYYVNLSLFFAFATLYAEMQFLVMFVIPVKAKWLAWLSGAMIALGVIQDVVYGNFLGALIPIVALLNYFIFFGEELMGGAKNAGNRVRHQTSRQTISYRKAVKAQKKQKGYLHKCCVCGKTDAEFPDMEFRYCSKCEGYRCYCMEHINNHEHA